MTKTQKLNDIMEFDHVVRVHEDGSVTDEPNVWTPDLVDGELSGSEWEFFTNGYSGQDCYSGPIMHDSEFIGGQLERDILANSGVYAVVVGYWTEEDGVTDVSEGWAVVRLKDVTA